MYQGSITPSRAKEQEIIKIMDHLKARIHCMASAIALYILGPDLSPNWSTASVCTPPFHLIPSSHLSSGCTGTLRYALSTSSLSLLPSPRFSALPYLPRCNSVSRVQVQYHHSHYVPWGKIGQLSVAIFPADGSSG